MTIASFDRVGACGLTMLALGITGSALHASLSLNEAARVSTACHARYAEALSAPEAPEIKRPTLDRLKALVGEWEIVVDGKPTLAVVVKVTSNGSVVHETMFPGSAHEMVNMYHQNGDELICTHYCAAGNQPRMRCTGVAPDGSMRFTFKDVTNLKVPDQEHMGEVVLTFDGQDGYTQRWWSVQRGQRKDEHVTIEMRRRVPPTPKPGS